jgi:patatin-like phospholipase/acyl hydrolase
MTSSNGDGAHDRLFKLLSIDGGGIRGLMSALVLSTIEKKTGKSISEMFDLVAGTSSGGVLALALARPSESVPAKPCYSASELVALFEEKGRTIFERSAAFGVLDRVEAPGRQRLHLPNGNVHDLFRPKYRDSGREEVLKAYLGYRLIDAVVDVFVPTYDTLLRKPIFLVSNEAHVAETDYYHSICDVSAVEAGLAATPTFFAPQKVRQPNYVSPPGVYSLVDGGLFANNPTFVAMAHAIKRYKQPTLQNMLVVSVGAGSLTRSYPPDEIRGWGQVNWAVPAIEMTIDGQGDAVGCMLEQFLPSARYHRFQTDLTKVNDDIDDISEENIVAIERAALRMLERKARELDELCATLTTSTPVTKTTDLRLHPPA